MSGVFAAWQPRYAEHGIPTFPVRIDAGDKKPAVKGYLKVGIGGSHQLALKFPAENALGFVLGKRTNITVLDIDTTCERARDAAFDRHGEPAVVVRTLRGHWQGWYRHNGEPRRIRPWQDKPIDLLGGGYVVGPASRGPHGIYEFVRGGLEAVRNLQPLRNLVLPTVAQVGGMLVQEGFRHKTLLRFCQEKVRHCDDQAALLDVARTYVEDNIDMLGMTHPTTDAEIVNAVSWAWALEVKGLNLVERGGATVVRHNVVDQIAASDPDAFALYTIVWRHNSDRREFILANSMAETMRWTLPRFKTTRARLCIYGLIKCVHRGGRGPGDPPRYRWVSK